MSFTILTREQIGLPPVVVGSTGVPRPPLDNETFVTFHYTGVSSRKYREADVAAEVRRIQAAFSATKPFEYNYVIGQREDTKIYEFAGTYVAAHSAGENSDSFGILFLNAVGEPLTDTQVRKAQWLRDVLIYTHMLRPQPEQRPHQWMPGAATACPGDAIMARLGDLVKPYTPPLPATPYNPAGDQWGLWPFAKGKPRLERGDMANAVLYANDVMREKAGQDTCGDTFNGKTTAGVRGVQAFFSVSGEVGFIGPKTWAVIDMLARQ